MKIVKQLTAIMSIDEFNKLIKDTEYSIIADSFEWCWGKDNGYREIKKPVSNLVEKICIERQIDERDGIEIIIAMFVSQKIVGNYNTIYVDVANDTVILLGE